MTWPWLSGFRELEIRSSTILCNDKQQGRLECAVFAKKDKMEHCWHLGVNCMNHLPTQYKVPLIIYNPWKSVEWHLKSIVLYSGNLPALTSSTRCKEFSESAWLPIFSLSSLGLVPQTFNPLWQNVSTAANAIFFFRNSTSFDKSNKQSDVKLRYCVFFCIDASRPYLHHNYFEAHLFFF